MAIQAGLIAIIAVICARNLAAAAGADALLGLAETALAVALIVGLVLANLLGVRWGSRIQNATVLAKVVTLLAVAAVAAFAAPRAPVAPLLDEVPARPGLAVGVLAALVPALFSYGGWQHAL